MHVPCVWKTVSEIRQNKFLKGNVSSLDGKCKNCPICEISMIYVTQSVYVMKETTKDYAYYFIYQKFVFKCLMRIHTYINNCIIDEIKLVKF